jgi:hypothetical protein
MPAIPEGSATVTRADREYQRTPRPSGPPDGALQTTAPAVSSPPVGTTFEGVGNHCDCLPPDASGDVGPSHYVEALNGAFAVFSKAGATLKPPTALVNLWSSLPSGLCKTHDDGDPVVVYDRLADRWVITQLAVQAPSNYHECLAVSKTSDPTGGYWAYDFMISSALLDDYPKIGVWPDGYYASFNDFDSGDNYTGVTAAVFERSRMLNGQSATGIKFELDATHNPMLPSQLDGRLLPPAGAPNQFVESIDPATLGLSSALRLYPFHVDWATPASSTFGPAVTLPVASFDSDLCSYNPCVPQPGTNRKLDALSDRMMQQLRYRNMGGSPAQERLVVNQTVDDGSDHAGIRWYELRRSGGAWSIHQQSTYSPDALHRWMGSAAMDGSGDLAVGYSASSGTSLPSIRYAGRTPADPLNSLEGETTMFSGAGSQLNTRWGDYTTLSVDPADDCTFWYVNEYYAATHGLNWHTRIGSFRFPTCVGIAGFSPTSGITGSAITITGTSLGAATGVTFAGLGGSRLASPGLTPVDASQLNATVPNGTVAGTVAVTSPLGTVTSAGNFTPTLSIQSFTPAGGAPGVPVTINGVGFTPSSTVRFGGAPAAAVAFVSANQLQATAPAASVLQTGPITVTNTSVPAGMVTSAGSFYRTPTIGGIAPAAGPVGTSVTISGRNFQGAARVTFNGTRASFTVNSPRSITATVPDGATTGRVAVRNPGGTATGPIFAVT